MIENKLNKQIKLYEVMNANHAFPSERFEGRGMVICAGGVKYFPSAYICASVLRMHGCKLQIQFWHLGPEEMSEEMKGLVAHLDVECVDALEVRKEHPARILKGWELKPYSIINCPFREVILIDADNLPLRDPEFLFGTEEYARTGAIFWPDFSHYDRIGKGNGIWDAVGLEFRKVPEFESGQIVVDKERCWKALQITMHMNEWSDFYYRHIYGDKDTYNFAWMLNRQAYSMPNRGVHALPFTMCQHDFEGNRLFQHRNWRKWNAMGDNPRIPDFLLEEECFGFLNELRMSWSIIPKGNDNPGFREVANRVRGQRRYAYERVGYDKREIELLPDNRISAGKGAVEHRWHPIGTEVQPRLGIFQDDRLLADLEPMDDRSFKGRWTMYERMPIVLSPV